ncbi:hypothetical protein [Ramlibacter sp.]|uniref:hypothetical protein n=1 Tax=Ramlibacter sp. TaxID=1917967 RepID=UPI002D4D1844|nr:hypothetical protein [Ramlibacter sp.]HYD76330.1 hypothetical protein [Ramlibacter sp.]
MKLATCSLLLAVALAGCSNTPMMRSSPTASSGASGTTMGASSGMRAEMNSRMCQVFRSYQGRGEDSWVQERCTMHLGAEGCNRCLSGQ